MSIEMLRTIAVIAASAVLAFPATAQDTIKIGASVSLSGPFAREGHLLKDGYDLWKDTVNSRGGVNIGQKNYKIEIVYYDDESKAPTSARLTEKLISEDKVSFLFGPYSSGIATATAAISERYKIITLTPMATANSLYERGYEYIYTPSPLADSGLFPILGLGTELVPKPEKVAIVGPDDLFPNVTGAGAVKKAKELGYEVVYNGKYPKSAVDLSEVANQIKAAAPDMILATGYAQDTIMLFNSFRELKIKPKLLGVAMSIGVDDFRTALGPIANGIMGVDYWVPTLTYHDPLFGSSQQFTKLFQERYGKTPTYHAASGAAAGVVLQAALEKAGAIETESVSKAMRALNLETFYGNVEFNEKGENVRATLNASQIIDNSVKVIYPEQVSDSKPLYPKP